MEQEQDIIKRVLEQFGKLLRSTWSALLNTKQQGTFADEYPTIIQSFENLSGLNIDFLLSLSDEELVKALKEKEIFNYNNFERLADIFYAIGEEEQNKKKRNFLLSKCLFVYDFIEKSEKTYSIERHFKMGRIKDMLN